MQKIENQDDEFAKDHQESMSKLKQCQQSLGRNSCFSCERVMDCEIRKSYVKAVYMRLSRGKEGGFEF